MRKIHRPGGRLLRDWRFSSMYTLLKPSALKRLSARINRANIYHFTHSYGSLYSVGHYLPASVFGFLFEK